MPNEMIERAKQAVWEMRLAYTERGQVMPDADEAIARAVIASLREPSARVAVAGYEIDKLGDWMLREPEDAWRAMIDHILTEEGETR